ncbi:thiazole biosynthesis protein [bacterium]|nr:thiazole biosynthesis protein [bacterium]
MSFLKERRKEVEKIISKAIVESYTKELLDNLEVDVAIAGAGPSGLICGYYLAKNGVKTAIFERSLRVGGGMPGGGMMFNKIVFEEESIKILEEFDINVEKYEEKIYVTDAIETISAFINKTVKTGAKIFNLISVEDIIIRENRINGVVLNWSAVQISKFHVDPLSVISKYVVDATGHDCEICRIVEKKVGGIEVKGEKSMWAEVGEKVLVENTKEVYPGLFICGMAANAFYGCPRMGAIFGGMVLSGKKAAEQIIEKL